MNKKKSTILLIAVLGVLIAGSALLYNSLSAQVEPELPPTTQENVPRETDSPQSETEGESQARDSEQVAAPDFTALDADGNEVKLSDLRGKPVVLNFWASWCPPCKREMPEFDKVYAELDGEVTFMMVDMTDGQRETMEIGAAFIAESGYSFPVYYDVNQEAAYGYGVSSIPTTFFIDKDGYIVTGAQGQINEELLRKGIGMIQEEPQ